MPTKHLTQHTYYLSDIHPNDSCDNCTTFKCDDCYPIYIYNGAIRYSLHEINIYKKECIKQITSLIGEPKSVKDVAFFIRKNVLYATIFKPFQETVRVKKHSIYYTDFYDLQLLLHSMWGECTCVDKHRDHKNILPCYKYGCTDTICFQEMKCKLRTNRRII